MTCRLFDRTVSTMTWHQIKFSNSKKWLINFSNTKAKTIVHSSNEGKHHLSEMWSFPLAHQNNFSSSCSRQFNIHFRFWERNEKLLLFKWKVTFWWGTEIHVHCEVTCSLSRRNTNSPLQLLQNGNMCTWLSFFLSNFFFICTMQLQGNFTCNFHAMSFFIYSCILLLFCTKWLQIITSIFSFHVDGYKVEEKCGCWSFFLWNFGDVGIFAQVRISSRCIAYLYWFYAAYLHN